MAAQVGDGDTVLVSHSGAGLLLPQIQARSVGDAGHPVFVDAGVPPQTGDARLIPSQFRAQLENIAVEGLLPKWSD